MIERKFEAAEGAETAGFSHGDLSLVDGEKSAKGFDRSIAAHRKQARDVESDLINQSNVLVAFGILDLIDADRMGLAWHPVLQSEGNDVFHRVEDLVPGGSKGLRCLFP